MTRKGFSKLKEGLAVIIINLKNGIEIGEGVITSKINENGEGKKGRRYEKGYDFEVLLKEPYLNYWKRGYYGFKKVELLPKV